MLKGWKVKVKNKVKYYGDVDYDKKIIVINKKLHKNKAPRYGIPIKDQTIINTLVHEKMHIDHPKMHEKNVRKNTRKKLEQMSTREKQAHYALLRRKPVA